MNLMVNNYCNLHCSYCFAQEEMHSKKAQNVTMENFCKYLDFLKKSEDYEVRLIGGEPTLDPDLPKLLDKVIEYNCFKRVLIFSNFTFSPELAEMICEKAKKIKINILININGFNLILPNQRNNILYNLDYLTTKLVEISNISINLFDPNMDLSQWEDIIAKYNIHTVRWSITVPNTVLSKDFDFYNFFHSFQPLLLQICSWREKYGIDLDCDCNGIPPCSLDPEAISYIIKIDPNFLGPVYCRGPVIDIAPNLQTRSCFAAGVSFTEEPKYLTDFENENEIIEYYTRCRSSLDGVPTRRECLSCSRYNTYGNSCSCLAYRKEEFLNDKAR